MKSFKHILVAILLLFSAGGASSASIATCTGKFPNPITDICWMGANSIRARSASIRAVSCGSSGVTLGVVASKRILSVSTKTRLV